MPQIIGPERLGVGATITGSQHPNRSGNYAFGQIRNSNQKSKPTAIWDIFLQSIADTRKE